MVTKTPLNSTILNFLCWGYKEDSDHPKKKDDGGKNGNLEIDKDTNRSQLTFNRAVNDEKSIA